MRQFYSVYANGEGTAQNPWAIVDLSHTGVPILVSTGVISGAALISILSRRGGERTPRAFRAFSVGLDGGVCQPADQRHHVPHPMRLPAACVERLAVALPAR